MNIALNQSKKQYMNVTTVFFKSPSCDGKTNVCMRYPVYKVPLFPLKLLEPHGDNDADPNDGK